MWKDGRIGFSDRSFFPASCFVCLFACLSFVLFGFVLVDSGFVRFCFLDLDFSGLSALRF